ncbi:MAG TPA: hypothetical protein VKB09_09295, partial [Thermomicrobiales bacterium]|nr:hypothetical protein [Thermomicrobiales bacterium]
MPTLGRAALEGNRRERIALSADHAVRNDLRRGPSGMLRGLGRVARARSGQPAMAIVRGRR